MKSEIISIQLYTIIRARNLGCYSGPDVIHTDPELCEREVISNVSLGFWLIDMPLPLWPTEGDGTLGLKGSWLLVMVMLAAVLVLSSGGCSQIWGFRK